MKRKFVVMGLVLGMSGVVFSSMINGAEIQAPDVQDELQPTQGRILSIEEYLDLATTKDTVFEEILIDELALQYEKDLGLPSRDLVVSVKMEHDFIMNQNREEDESSISLDKLFPFTGTEVGVEYKTTPSLTSPDNSGEFTFELTQPIAENAFGKVTRLKDKIIGLEVDVATYQIVEAYEDYLATTLTNYLDWYEAHENLSVGESTYKENLKLLENIRERQKSNIALPIDVNKVHLQVLAKKEKLIDLKEKYDSATNYIRESIRYKGSPLVPQRPEMYDDLMIDFERDFRIFREDSRTWKILRLLEEKAKFEVEENANDLFPSIDLRIGYNVKGKGYDIHHDDNMIYTGVTLEWPFPDQVERAEYESSKVARDKATIKVNNKYYRYAMIRNLSLQVDKEYRLKEVAEEKISLARSILEDETENYSFGKVTLNDYIDAVNLLDTNRFNQISHDVQQKKLVVEWLRITDQLISKKDIKSP